MTAGTSTPASTRLKANPLPRKSYLAMANPAIALTRVETAAPPPAKMAEFTIQRQ
jgi:hypothetical protein